MENQFTAVFRKTDRWRVGYVEELPGARFVKEPLLVTTAVPWHAEVDDFLTRKTCRDLGIPQP